MRKLIIIGNSGAARECHDLFLHMLAASYQLNQDMVFKGFLSWRDYPMQLCDLASHALGDVTRYTPCKEDCFAIGIGDPSLREEVYLYCRSRGLRFFTLIHPLSEISDSAQLGEANIFQRNSTVFANARVGNANYFNGAVNVSHDAAVEDYNFLGPFSLVLGEARLGSGNTLGAHCTLLPHAQVGNKNILAPGCVIYKGCKDFCRMAGNPALNIGKVESL